MSVQQQFYPVSPARHSDSREIWSIHYHPIVNATALSAFVVDFQHHDKWFIKQYFSGLPNQCFVAREGGRVIGYCRFDKKNEVSEVSIAVHPDYHGQGVGHKLLKEAICLYASPRTVFRALIKKNNNASEGLFLRNGFVKVSETPDYFIMERHIG